MFCAGSSPSLINISAASAACSQTTATSGSYFVLKFSSTNDAPD